MPFFFLNLVFPHVEYRCLSISPLHKNLTNLKKQKIHLVPHCLYHMNIDIFRPLNYLDSRFRNFVQFDIDTILNEFVDPGSCLSRFDSL